MAPSPDLGEQMQLDVRGAFESVEFDGFNWFFQFDDGVTLGAQTLWRFLSPATPYPTYSASGRVVRVSEDHLQQFGHPAPIDLVSEMTTLLAGKSLERITIDDYTYDLTLTFTDGSQLQVFISSSGYEQWWLWTSTKMYRGGGDSIIM